MNSWLFRLRSGGRKRGEALPGLRQAGVEAQGGFVFAAGFRVAFGLGQKIGLVAVERGAVRLKCQRLLALGQCGGKLAPVVKQSCEGAMGGGMGGVKPDGLLIFLLGVGRAFQKLPDTAEGVVGIGIGGTLTQGGLILGRGDLQQMRPDGALSSVDVDVKRHRGGRAGGQRQRDRGGLGADERQKAEG